MSESSQQCVLLEFVSAFTRERFSFCEKELFYYRTTDIIQRKPLTDGRDARQILTVANQETLSSSQVEAK